MTENTFDNLWKTIFQAASKKSVDYSSFYATHQIRKLLLPKLRISDIQQKVAQFAIRYNSRHHTNSKTWMENQYRIFLWAILNYSQMVSRLPLQFKFQDWDLLSKMFDKPPVLCNYFYMCSRKGRNSAWTQQQDKFLCQVMKIPEYKGRWTDIGMLLFFQTGTSCFRKPKAIRQRWLNHLNPQIIKYQWSLQQDLVIFNMVLQQGKRWSKISRTLKNRSEHAIKNRYNGLIGQKIRNSSFQTRGIKEEKAIRTYISKIKNILSSQKKIDIQNSQEKIIPRTGEKKENQNQSQEQNSLFNYGLNSLGFCIFQPTLIIHPQNKL